MLRHCCSFQAGTDAWRRAGIGEWEEEGAHLPQLTASGVGPDHYLQRSAQDLVCSCG